LLVAYLLLPNMPTYSILYLVSASLALAAGIYILIARAYGRVIVAGVVLFVALLRAFDSAPPPNGEDGFRVLFRAESVYGRVQVVEDVLQGIRWLMSDCSVVGAESIRGGASMYPFVRMVEAVRYLHPSGRTALQIGLGTGAVPRLLAAAGIRTDVVEIDGNVARAARDYFGFKGDGDLFIEDGRQFLRRAERRYDFVIHDTFTGGTVPFHLFSRQVFLDIRRILTEEGVLCLVFVGYFSGNDALGTRSIFRTLSEVFPHVRLVADPDNATEPSNLVFFASSRPFQWAPEKWTGLGKVVQAGLMTQQKTLSPSEGWLITDKLNALDLWQLDRNQIYRRWMVRKFPVRILID
jgi:spermidine synthase